MKKIPILFIIISNVISVATAQPDNSHNEYGKFYDINGLLLNDYCDFDYTPEKIFKISLVVGEKYTPGIYYDNKGIKHDGYILIDKSTYAFSFKSQASGPFTLSPESCSGIKIGVDSFAVIKNFEIQRTFGKAMIGVESFAEVIAETPNYTLYKHTRFGLSSVPSETFVIKTDTSNHLTSIHNSETLIRYFGDCKLLKKQIAQRSLTIDDLPSISKTYEYYHKFKNKRKIFYSSSWDELKDSINSKYFAKIVSIRDTIWELNVAENKGTPIYLGHYSSFSPAVKDGDFLWFLPNGNVRKKITYKNNEIVGEVTEYYADGSPHYIYKYKRNKIIYDKIFSRDGKDVLNENGLGVEDVFDSVLHRNLTKRYNEAKLTLCGFTNDSGKLVMQQCEENARLNSFNSIQNKINKYIVYPEKSIINYQHGFVLVRFMINESGNFTEFNIIKGLGNDCDEQIKKFITEQKTKITFTPAMYKGNKFAQEIIVPFCFEISGLTIGSTNSYFYDNFMFRQQFMQPRINIPTMPATRFR